MRRLLLLLLLAALAAPAAARADSVVPSDQVRSRLLVRGGAAAKASQVGSLKPGERAEYLETRGGWHHVRLADGTEGFVSAAWSRVVPDTATDADTAAVTGPVHVSVAHRGLGEAFRSFVQRVGAWLGAPPPVELVLRDPVRDEARYAHDDPLLPVAGLATLEGSSGTWDVVLVLDTSTSTQESSRADVNGDGRLDEGWNGPDSIYRAEIRAARDFVAELGRLPNNHGGERLHLGVVGFAGEREAPGSGFQASPAALLELARRDAELLVPVTGDYAHLDRALAKLADREPDGMTDFAAGVGQGLAALGVLSTGVAAEAPRGNAQKALLFLTDGKPQLPGDRRTAERAALYASELAGRAGVRIHSFALGRDVVRREANPVLGRMARGSGGHFTQLERPGDIVATLRSTSFSFVSQVRLVNRTLGKEIPEIATGIDGSFYGELPLTQGANQIEVEALLNDGRHTTRKLTIDYVDTKPMHEMQRKLAALRKENAALVEQLRQRMAHRIREARIRQDRDVTIRAERNAD